MNGIDRQLTREQARELLKVCLPGECGYTLVVSGRDWGRWALSERPVYQDANGTELSSEHYFATMDGRIVHALDVGAPTERSNGTPWLDDRLAMIGGRGVLKESSLVLGCTCAAVYDRSAVEIYFETRYVLRRAALERLAGITWEQAPPSLCILSSTIWYH
ncbi:MAG: hypothetical protein K2X03_11005 [Bryobacteraceae bacterium]|nr:hypothetical protein [Bryobacteraceae bacterium]